jgi:hypothetical protein
MERIIEPDEIILIVDHRRLTDREEEALHKAIARSKRKEHALNVKSSEKKQNDKEQGR